MEEVLRIKFVQKVPVGKREANVGSLLLSPHVFVVVDDVVINRSAAVFVIARNTNKMMMPSISNLTIEEINLKQY